jgi:hypothetical protein
MDELIGRLVANAGVERGVAEKSLAIILDFLRKEGPADKVQALLDKLPGAEALLAQQPDTGGGMFSMGGIMGVGTRLMGAGLYMGQIQAVTRELMAYSREHNAGDVLGEIAEAIPGLGQFI